MSQGYSLHTDRACALFGFAGLVLICGRQHSLGAWLGAGLCVGLALWQGAWAECYDAVITNALFFATQPLSLRTAAGVWLMLPAVPLAVVALLVMVASGRLRQVLKKSPHSSALLLFAVTGVVV